MSNPEAPPLPEVRQCQDAENFLHGASAVSAGNGRWGVMHPVNGGHWATDADVASWPVAEFPEPAPEPEPEPEGT